MIAMQYNFVLPADYDMSIVDRRIAEKAMLADSTVSGAGGTDLSPELGPTSAPWCA